MLTSHKDVASLRTAMAPLNTKGFGISDVDIWAGCVDMWGFEFGTDLDMWEEFKKSLIEINCGYVVVFGIGISDLGEFEFPLSQAFFWICLRRKQTTHVAPAFFVSDGGNINWTRPDQTRLD